MNRFLFCRGLFFFSFLQMCHSFKEPGRPVYGASAACGSQRAPVNDILYDV